MKIRIRLRIPSPSILEYDWLAEMSIISIKNIAKGTQLSTLYTLLTPLVS